MSLPPPPATKNLPPPAPAMSGMGTTTKKWNLRSGAMTTFPINALFYGTGGIGKTTLACLAPNPVLIDVNKGGKSINVPAVSGIETYSDLLNCLRSPELDGFSSVVIDSMTDIENLIHRHVLETVPLPNGGRATSIESWDWGKGYRFLAEQLRLFIQELERLSAKSKNVVLIAHEITSKVPNPSGADFIRFEPDMYKGSQVDLRQIVKNWVDFMFYIQYDMLIAKDGTAQGNGTRSIYTTEMPTFLAKSRTLPGGGKLDPRYPFKSDTDATLWSLLIPAQGAK